MSENIFDDPRIAEEAKLYLRNLQIISAKQIKGREFIGVSLTTHLRKLAKHLDGINVVIDTVKGGSKENTELQLRNALSATRDCIAATSGLLELMIPYVMAGNMEQNATKTAIKLGGDPNFLLRETLRRKMQGE